MRWRCTIRNDTIRSRDSCRLAVLSFFSQMNELAQERAEIIVSEDKFQGTTPTKKRRTKLFDSCFEAAVALAELIQQPQEQDDPIKHLDFASPISGAPPARCVWAAGRRAIVPQCPAAKANACELPCVHVGMPMTTAQLSLAHICGMPFVRAVPSVPDVSYSPHAVGVAIAM